MSCDLSDNQLLELQVAVKRGAASPQHASGDLPVWTGILPNGEGLGLFYVRDRPGEYFLLLRDDERMAHRYVSGANILLAPRPVMDDAVNGNRAEMYRLPLRRRRG